MIKHYSYPLLYLIFFITIFSLQLYFLTHEHTQFNILLIMYTFVLFNNCRISILTILAFMLDVLTYMITLVSGLSILWLIGSSWFSLRMKNNMYNKIVLPCLFIIAYAAFYNIVIAYYISEVASASSTIYQIIKSSAQNCAGLILLWKIFKKSFHD